ncbi:MAG: hypothetical protein HWN67_01535 [Candidatus Helarchaeota archaeon]|nr:hypothetical protein [Candidatus Helarchaeota archaeon]
MGNKIICSSCKAPVNKPLKEEQFICEYCGALNRVNSKFKSEDTFEKTPGKKNSILLFIIMGIMVIIMFIVTMMM